MSSVFETEKRELSKFGYIHLKNVLTPHEISKTLKGIDNLIFEHIKENSHLYDAHNCFGRGAFRIYEALEKLDDIDFLIDHPKVFDLLLELIGDYIQLMGSEIFIRNPHNSVAERFHTDAGPAIQKFVYQDNIPLLQLKIQFFLTDTLTENSGNFMCIPGTHRIPVKKYEPGCFIKECNTFLDQGIFPPHTHQFLARAGDAVIFPWCLWHGATHNESSNTRRSVCFRYGQLFCRPYDYVNISKNKLTKLTPRQRRLCGDLSDNPDNFFEPCDYYKISNQFNIIRQL